ncbi:hypothetical protein IJG90_01860 [Candidatus Saccharibacteria bacterium]|nr:hypothetical protein [Candidatus Saccharibacteria bacterium]
MLKLLQERSSKYNKINNMENYHGDYDELAEFIDALIVQKYPNEPKENHKELREQLIQDLSSRIDEAAFKDLSDDQVKDLEYAMEHQKSAPGTYLEFFNRADIDFRGRVKDVMLQFGKEFLGGEKNE